MKYIVYQTVNKVNNKIYIGVHGTETDDFDGYIGNGISIYRPATYMNPKTPFQFAVKKYGVKNFIRTTLKEFDNEKPNNAMAVIPTLIAVTFPVPNLKVNLSLKRLEKIVPTEIMIDTIPANDTGTSNCLYIVGHAPPSSASGSPKLINAK